MKDRNRARNKAGSSDTMKTKASSEPVGAGTTPKRAADDRGTTKTASAPRGGSFTATATLSHERVAERARALWLASGCVPGRDEQNWREAEKQLKVEAKSG